MPAFAALRQSDRSHFSSCDLCGHSLFVIVADKDRLGHPLQTVVCQACGLVSTNPRPGDDELERFYREDYRQAYKQAWRPKLKHVHRAGRVALERLEYLLPLLQPGQNLLDLGAGGGELLFMLRGLGLAVQLTTYQQAVVDPGSLDVVTCFHVLEHLPDPVAALSAMAGWLRSDGLLLVEVPHVMARCQWPHSRYHIGHLHHFSSSTLALAGQKAGLRPVDAFTSADGGNLMLVFRKGGVPPGQVLSTIPGHAQRVVRHLRTHTPLAHLLSPHPYLRPLEKLSSRLREQLTLLQCRDVHALLDRLLRDAQRLAQALREAEPRMQAPLLSCAVS